MDPLQFFLKNVNLTNKPDVYRAQLNKAAEMIEWSKYGHARPDTSKGTIKRGLGNRREFLGWAGSRQPVPGHDSIGRQRRGGPVQPGSRHGDPHDDRQVAAETFGLEVGQVTIGIGDTNYPPSGGSGGSTTIGGVSVSTRKAAVNALGKIFDLLSPIMGVPADQLEAVDGRIQPKGAPTKA